MKLHKLLVFFAVVVFIANISYPISSFADSDKESHSNGKKDDHVNEKDNNSDNENNNNHNQKNNKNDSSDNEHKNSDKGGHEVKDKSEIAYDTPDEEDNRYPSGKDKIGYDGGLDKDEQDGNNGCGNDDDFEDYNNGNCKGKNNASETGCLYGEPDCENNEQDEDQDDEHDGDEDSSGDGGSSENDDPSGTGEDVIVYVTTNITNENSEQADSQVLSASTLASTGDYLMRLGFTLLFTGLISFMLGLYFLGRKAIEKVFKSSYQTYLYVYEA